MIARKITYLGKFTQNELKQVFEVARKIEITGEISLATNNSIQLCLEGDPSMIKLIEHQIERKIPGQIEGKEVITIPFQNFQSITLVQNSKK